MSEVSSSNIRVGATIQGLLDNMKKASKVVGDFTRDVNSKLADSYKKANKEQSVFRGGLVKLGDDITSIGKKMAVVGSLPVLFAAGKTFKDYADLQKLEIGLKRYGETLEGVRELAKLPNIGVFDGAKTLIGLRAVGLEGEKAKNTIKAFANAITEAGGSAADLEPALINIKQFLATGNINQVDLRQLSFRIPQVNQALRDAFGTTDTAKLNDLGTQKVVDGLVEQLSKIPPVAGGAGMAMDQASDSLIFFSATIGEAIDKSFDITAKIGAVGGVMDDLATNFKALNPEAQKAILWIGGMAVAIPALTIAVGGLIKLWPLLATGLGVSWPVAAILATTAAIGGLTALLPLLNSNLSELNKQQDIVAKFSGKINPLIEEYDNLQKQTKLNTDEQKRLREITAILGGEVPTAVTAWDNYGNAIDVNITKVRSYIKEQRELLSAMQDTRRESLVRENSINAARASELQKLLNTGKQTDFTVDTGDGVTTAVGGFSKKLGVQELKEYSKELKTLQDRQKANQRELLSLGGQDLYVKARERIKQMEKLQAQYSTEYKAALKSDNLALIKSIQEKAQALDADIANEKTKWVPAIKAWNKAKEDARKNAALKVAGTPGVSDVSGPAKLSSLSISELEEKLKTLTDSYKSLSPTAKDYKEKQAQIAGEIRDVTLRIFGQSKALNSSSDAAKDAAQATKESGKYYKDMTEQEKLLFSIDLASKYERQKQAVKDATEGHKKLLGVVAALNIEYQKNKQGTLGDSTFAGLEKAKALGDEIADRTMPVAIDYIDRSANASKKNDYLRENASLDLKRYFGSTVDLADMRKMFAEIPEIAGESSEKYGEKLTRFAELSKFLSSSMSDALRDMANNVAIGFGEMLGDLASGVNGVAEFGKRVIGALGGMLKDMGKSLIAAGTAGIALKVFMNKPALALAAGIALTAVGQTLGNKLKDSAGKVTSTRFAKGGFAYKEMSAIVGDNRNARFDPEMIAPYSKVDQSIKKSIKETGGAGSNVFIADVTIKGEDLRIAFKRAEQSNKALKGR